jgi:hypothetical protein
MTSRIILELITREGFNFDEVVQDQANGQRVDLSDCELIQHISVIDSFRDEFIKYIEQHGLSALMRRETLTEALVAPGTTSSTIELLLQGFLKALSVGNELVIVDPYFFAKTTDASYPNLIQNVLLPVLPRLRTLTVITLPNKVDTALVANISHALTLHAPNLSVFHKTTTTFHDRFWINPVSSKGFICGSSLNGLGKKYALVDHLQQSDAKDVINALRKQGLL